MAPVEYRIELRDPHSHLVAIEARFPVGGGAIDLKLPVWTPGSYLIREFERHLQELTVTDAAGRPLAVAKVDKATWRVDAAGAQAITARYRVYANELTVRTSHFDDRHAFLNGASLFLYHPPLAGAEARVTIAAPEDWRTSVALPEVAPNTFLALSYDELVDSPFEVGTHELLRFEVLDRPHRLALFGQPELPHDLPLTKVVSDIGEVIRAAAAIFSDALPYDDYLFLLLLTPNAYGGLEHSRSSSLLASPFSFHPRSRYEELLELVAHEYFHLWNVKRIRPAPLGPFDYGRETYTRNLWVSEGLTSYYDRYLLVRAGLQSAERYTDKVAEELSKIAALPGRHRQSVEESSFDAWIKLYRPDENSANSTISYYLKGGMIGLLLDLEIRLQTRHRRSLDDLMRLLWQRYGKRDQGFPEAGVQAIAEEATGAKLGDFFARHVHGRGELEAARLLRTVGLLLEADRSADDPKEPWLGATTRDEGDALVIGTVFHGGPAMRDGLYANDQLLALDGYRVDGANLKERLATRRPGEAVTLTLFRRDQLREVTLTLGERPADKFRLTLSGEATAEEKAGYTAWLGAPWPGDPTNA